MSPVPAGPTPDCDYGWARYHAGTVKEDPDLATAARRARAGEGVVWLGMKDPKDDDLAWFADSFDLHPLAVEDAVHGHARSKLEYFDDTLFVVVSTVAYEEHATIVDAAEIVSTGQIMIFVGPHFVLTVRKGGRSQMQAIRRALEADPVELVELPWRILYRTLDRVVDDYLEVVAEIEQDVDEVEALIFSDEGPAKIDRAYLLKRELIEFKRAVMPLGPVLAALSTRLLPHIPEESRAYFRELSDHHIEAREALTSFDDILTTILQAALARQSVSDNQDMRKISAAVGILAVPTTIAAIYGMNFDNMPELRTEYGYFVVMGVTAMLMLIMYMVLRRNKWL